MKTPLYNQNNEQVGTVELPDAVFNVPWNPDLVHQVTLVEQSKQWQPIAHTKTRGEVRGGGKKPWKQKHTGRARHSSIRSPLWSGGGVTFGPRNTRVLAKTVNKKMKRKAMNTVLSKKLKDDELRIVDSFVFNEQKTKQAAIMLKHFLKKPTSVLLIGKKDNNGIVRAARNIPRLTVVRGPSFSVLDCLKHRYLFLEKDAISELTNVKS
ncbi:50S ribosomal protein L4 [Candidatus Jorgensenbacteria bacterium]|nr:50S ribosomal protein L4 [Candidatus Jorgensenbacteria bacterium]